jgi:hypothetical protein
MSEFLKIARFLGNINVTMYPQYNNKKKEKERKKHSI